MDVKADYCITENFNFKSFKNPVIFMKTVPKSLFHHYEISSSACIYFQNKTFEMSHEAN